jgi:hypothetical protein
MPKSVATLSRLLALPEHQAWFVSLPPTRRAWVLQRTEAFLRFCSGHSFSDRLYAAIMFCGADDSLRYRALAHYLHPVPERIYGRSGSSLHPTF